MAVAITIPGYTINAKYKEGGSAAIYKARKHGIGEEELVALKMLLPQHEGSKDMVRAFLQEAKILAGTKHPYIIRYHRIVDEAPRPTIELEFFESDHVKMVLKKRAEAGEVLPLIEGLQILRKVGEAITYLHGRGIAHRDIKPENILVNRAGDVRVIDFSIAEPWEAGFLKRLFGGKPKVTGTLTYLAPEQLQQKRADWRADIYSFGVVAYETLTGAPPFKGLDPNKLIKQHLTENPVPPRRIRDDIPIDLEELLLRMLKKMPEARPLRMGEVVGGLEHAIAQLSRWGESSSEGLSPFQQQEES